MKKSLLTRGNTYVARKFCENLIRSNSNFKIVLKHNQKLLDLVKLN